MRKNYFDKEMAIQKGIYDNKDATTYIKMTNLYKKVFEKYLCTEINLKEFDKKILESNLGFGASETKEHHLNRLQEYFDLKLFSNLNLFFVEKLNPKDIALLRETIEQKNHSYSELKQMVANTYKTVITDDITDNNGDPYVNYSNVNEVEYFRNGAIALKISFILTTSTWDKDEFFAAEKKRKSLLEEVKDTVENRVKEKMGTDCDVLIEMFGK